MKTNHDPLFAAHRFYWLIQNIELQRCAIEIKEPTQLLRGYKVARQNMHRIEYYYDENTRT